MIMIIVVLIGVPPAARGRRGPRGHAAPPARGPVEHCYYYVYVYVCYVCLFYVCCCYYYFYFI